MKNSTEELTNNFNNIIFIFPLFLSYNSIIFFLL